MRSPSSPNPAGRSSLPLRADPPLHAEPEAWTADLRAAMEKLTAEHRARVDTLLAPFTVASFTGETPTAAELAARDREEAARARQCSKGKPPPRRATDPDPTNTALPPLDALNAIED